VPNLHASTLLDFLIADFETAWNQIALLPNTVQIGRGNFMFAKLSMTVLELSCRICAADTRGDSLKRFSSALAGLEPKYFTELPRKGRAYFDGRIPLPSISPTPGNDLLSAMFDLVRNGQAHQYQQIQVQLEDRTTFGISVTGPSHGMNLGTLAAMPRPSEHLRIIAAAEPNVWILLRTDRFFLDLKAAIERAGLRDGALSHLERSYPSVTSASMHSALAGHLTV